MTVDTPITLESIAARYASSPEAITDLAAAEARFRALVADMPGLEVVVEGDAVFVVVRYRTARYRTSMVVLVAMEQRGDEVYVGYDNADPTDLAFDDDVFGEGTLAYLRGESDAWSKRYRVGV